MSTALRKTSARSKAPATRGGNAPLELDPTLSFMRTLWALHHELRLGSKRNFLQVRAEVTM